MEKENSISANLCSFSNSVLLATAVVKVYSDEKNFILVRALIDQCSQSSFISEFVCQKLSLKRQSVNLLVSGVGGKKSCTCKTFVKLNVGPHFQSEFSCPVDESYQLFSKC